VSQDQAKIDREREFHNQRFGSGDEERIPIAKYYSINRYQDDHFNGLVKAHCGGADLLDYGCAMGATALEWTRHGARVTGIDISDEGIRIAKEMARSEGVDIRFEAMNAEVMTPLKDRSFDLVVGRGILHHLDLEKSLSEIGRVLRPDGLAVFIEPMGHNPFINLFRWLTPSIRTPDEHPIVYSDFDIARRYFERVDVTFYHVTTLLAVPLRKTRLFEPALGFLHRFDQILMRWLPITRRLAWTIVWELRSPVER
jgi:SAM-dependent methyltransferase